MFASGDLKKAGVNRKRLVFEPAKVAELTSGLTTNTEAELADLHSRIKKIYAHECTLYFDHLRFYCLNDYLLVVRFAHES
jgi:hypothetical protein